jgi:hypothetical protein
VPLLLLLLLLLLLPPAVLVLAAALEYVQQSHPACALPQHALQCDWLQAGVLHASCCTHTRCWHVLLLAASCTLLLLLLLLPPDVQGAS